MCVYVDVDVYVCERETVCVYACVCVCMRMHACACVHTRTLTQTQVVFFENRAAEKWLRSSAASVPARMAFALKAAAASETAPGTNAHTLCPPLQL